MNKSALIVVTSNSKLGDSGEKTGWHLSEVSHVYWPLVDAGFTVEFASPKGGAAPLDKSSFKLDDSENKSFVERFKVEDSLDTLALSDVNSSEFQVIYFAGGHGTMWDFPDNEDIQRVTSEIYENNGIVSAVCHGPSALTSVKLSDGKYLVDGKSINSFTDAEEREVKKDNIVPFMLETRLRERGANFQGAKNWGEKVVVDGRLVTGQNPQSASALGKAIVRTFEDMQNMNAGQSSSRSDANENRQNL